MANIGSDTTYTQTNVYRFIHKTIVHVFIFCKFVLIEMREKLRSQRETVMSLPISCMPKQRVPLMGLEPTTDTLRVRRTPLCATPPPDK